MIVNNPKKTLNNDKLSPPSFSFRDHIFNNVLPELELPSFNTNLPTRRVVPTYLRGLDRVMRGGWSWQWPLVIAGPKNAGKSQFVYQLLASALLSYLPPWHCIFFNCGDDYRFHRIQNILIRRIGRQKSHQHSSRIDKVTILDRGTFLWSFILALKQGNLALLVVDGFDRLLSEISFVDVLQVLIELQRLKQVGVIITIRGSLEELLSQLPWESIPFFFYITKLRHHRHHLRVWLNGANYKVYDQSLTLRGLFKEYSSSPSRGKRK
jgi:hypothetical protein